MTRGFVTIATGQERYFELARNLMYSYRQFASHKYPFAILTDKENQYTKEFDDVIVMNHAHCNYLDKLSLYDYLPYDETIFIDADSLAYGDLDKWWDIFEKADDFSLIGYMWTDLKSGRGWFSPAGTNEFADRIKYIPDFNGGIYYMRRGETCKEVFRLANFFAEHYHEYKFNDFVNPADEPVLGLAMAIMQCKPIDLWDNGLCFAPSRKQAKLDISVPSAECNRLGKTYKPLLLHWSNYRTKMAWYHFEVEKLKSVMQGKDKGLLYRLLYRYKIRYCVLWIYNLIAFSGRIKNKVKKITHK